jgi:mannose-6-phosphate isomerase-like protein (cupin superfamily)
MKFIGAFAILLAMAVLMTGAGGGLGATYVGHDKLMATLAKGGTLAKTPEYTVGTNVRTESAVPEIHEKTTHIWYVLDGSATYVTGGTLIGGKVTKPGLTQGTTIEGGNTVQLTKGDVIVIPPGTPHWWKEVPKSITLYAVNTQ